eukprot:TRINITY_DN71_c0_g1_i2.p1 TRINITY_DN71_c0_g1~~TRINITY_DN71_c0_g1_i2.p1  ORF type:complete len:497 (-),score=144.39 TRINITY_DN71_c0_g1_i2:841-2331(-)
MDCIQIVRNYIEQMIGETGGMKALILDDVTKGIVSQVYSMSEMLEKQTFHLEEIGSEHEKTGYMKAIVFVRPTNENCNKLCEHLKNPLYSEYYLFFSNVVDHDCLRRLAEADEHMLVKGCRESFIDFFAMNPDMFVVGVPHSLRFFQNRERWSPIEKNAFHRSADGLVSFLLAAQKKPFIRHQVGSNLAASLANEVVSKMDREKDLFKTVRQTGMSVLTVVDRREDPITPLMLPWTYQALVHELFTITSNKVTLPDGKDFVLSITQDEFFQEHLFANLGEVMKDVSQLTTQFQNERKATTNGGHSIEELKRLIHNMPKLQEKQHTVSKHVSISTSIGNLMDDVQLMHQSELEVAMVQRAERSKVLEEIKELIRNPRIPENTCIRMCVLYALCYEDSDGCGKLRTAMGARGIAAEKTFIMEKAVELAGVAARKLGLFEAPKGVAKMFSAIKKATTESIDILKHKPLIMQLIDRLSKGKVKDDSECPFVGRKGNWRDM